jgi:hypothetical protein
MAGITRRSFIVLLGGTPALSWVSGAAALADALAAPADEQSLTAQRIGDRPILRPEMMPQDDGEWSGNINFPCLVRVPDWLSSPLGKYYLYFSAHHGSYIRLAYANQVAGPWKIHEPGTLRLEQVEKVNDAAQSPQRHVASPDVHFDDVTKEVRLYFHYNLPKLGHSSSVAFSKDGLHFDPRPGRIAGPYLRVWRRGDAYIGLDDQGMLLRSTDGIKPFEPLSDCVRKIAGEPGRRVSFRHGGVLPIGADALLVCFSRVGDAPEKLMWTRVDLAGEAAKWTASAPRVLLEPEREYEGAKAPLEPSTVMGQTNVRQLRDPFLFQEGDQTWLFYAVAGETGIGLARLTLPRS